MQIRWFSLSDGNWRTVFLTKSDCLVDSWPFADSHR